MTNEEVLKILKERGINKTASAIGASKKEEPKMSMHAPQKKQGFFSNLKTQFSPQANLETINQKGLAKALADTNTVQFTLGMGDAINNMMSNVMTSLSKPVNGKVYGEIHHGDQSNPFYQAGEITGEMGAYLGGGGAAGLAVKGLPKVGAYLGGEAIIPSAARGIVGGTGAAALLNPNDMKGAAEEGLIWSTAAEALPFGLRGAHKASKAISGNEGLEKVMASIKSGFEGADTAVSSGYGAIEQGAKESGKKMLPKYGQPAIPEKMIGGYLQGYQKQPGIPGTPTIPAPGNMDYAHKMYGELAEKKAGNPNVLDWMSSDSKKLNKQFMSEGDYIAAHKLQSKLGSDIRATKDWDKRNRLVELRNSLNSDIESFLGAVDPSLASQLKEVRNYTAKVQKPYESSPVFKNIKEDITNRTTLSSIKDAIEKGMEYKKGGKYPGIPKDHPLTKQLEAIANARQISDIGALGMMLDAAKSKLGIDILGSTIENQKMVELAKKLKEPYSQATKAGMSQYFTREER